MLNKRFRIVSNAVKDKDVSALECSLEECEAYLVAIDTSISECIDILHSTEGMSKEEFIEDRMIQKSTAMSMLMIGNFMKKMPNEIKDTSEQIRAAYGYRCKIAHDYGNTSFDYLSLWYVVQYDVKPLLDALRMNKANLER